MSYVLARMAAAKAKMIGREQVPRVFFLTPGDFDEFALTKPGTVEAMFALPLGSKPSLMTCLAFDGIAVRQSQQKNPKHGVLYSCNSTTVAVSK